MPYFIMHSGQAIDPTNIQERDINLDDIAHHLTKTCRFTGALPLDTHYSVAQHSVKMATWARKAGYPLHIQRACLMHDASEAYLGDINGVLKPLLSCYKHIESDLQQCIEDKYILEYLACTYTTVHTIDKRILLNEAATFFPDKYLDFYNQSRSDITPLDGVTLVNETNLEQTKQLFLYWCKKLNIKDRETRHEESRS